MQSKITVNGSIGGLSISGSFEREGNTSEPHDPTLAAGKAGTLTTRSDDNTGVATLAADHGIQSAEVVDVYWEGGSRHSMVATVSGTAVSLEGGAGDVLPADESAVVVCKHQTISNVTFAGAMMTLFGASCPQRCMLHFYSSAPALLATIEIKKAGEAYIWAEGATPIDGTVATATATNGSTTAAQVKFSPLLP